MNNKATTFVRKKSLYMANPKSFTNLTVPLLRHSKRRKYFNDKTTAMIGNQCPFMEGCKNVIIMDLAIHLPLRAALDIHTKLLISNH